MFCLFWFLFQQVVRSINAICFGPILDVSSRRVQSIPSFQWPTDPHQGKQMLILTAKSILMSLLTADIGSLTQALYLTCLYSHVTNRGHRCSMGWSRMCYRFLIANLLVFRRFVHLMVLHLPDARIAADAEFVTDPQRCLAEWSAERAQRLLKIILDTAADRPFGRSAKIFGIWSIWVMCDCRFYT